MHKIISKSNFICPDPTPLDKVSVVDKLLFEPLANTIARMEASGYVAAEYRRKMNSAMYDSRMVKSEGELDSLSPMPMYEKDFTDTAYMRDSANYAINERVKESAVASAPSSEVNNG